MNASLLRANRFTYLKIVVVGMLGAIAVTSVTITHLRKEQHSYLQSNPPIVNSVVPNTIDATRNPSLSW
jgi:hypothetical protein